MRLTGDVNSDLYGAIMSTVHYFDIFRHPLQKNEIYHYMHQRMSNEPEFSKALNFLVKNNFIFEKEGYFLPSHRYENIHRRNSGEKTAGSYWDIAIKKSKFISRFPFVRSVIITGSLSKGFMDEKSDIDFLIITKPGRVWIARTMMVLYKKIFLLNSHKHFCINYFLDENNLKLTDRNIFTATELLFAKPLYNKLLFSEMIKSNSWAISYFPQLRMEPYGDETIIEQSPFKSMMEYFLNGKAGSAIDILFMNIYLLFRKIKFGHMSLEQLDRDMKSTRGISKHHPNGFRDYILEEHKRRMDHFRHSLNRTVVHESFAQDVLST